MLLRQIALIKARFPSSGGLLANLSWMLCTEMSAKISRIVTILVMAALLTITEYGIATLALALHELIRIFSRAGAGSRVIQCDQPQVASLAGNASLLQWLICIVLSLVQILLAPSIASFYQLPDLVILLNLMALTYLFYPIVSIKVFMLQRANNMRYFGIASAIAITVDNLSIALFLWLDCGVLAIAYAKLTSALVWVLLFLPAKTAFYRPHFDAVTFWGLVRYSAQVFSSDLLRTLRSHLDVLIAARILPLEWFGLYSFAKNAGVGLAQSLINAFLSALYPFICQQLRMQPWQVIAKQSLLFAMATSGLFVAQAVAAPWYVTWLFSAQWHDAGWLVSVLCLSSVSAILLDTRGFFYRAQNQVGEEAKIMLFAALSSACCILWVNPQTAMALAITTTSASLLWLMSIIPFLVQILLFNKKIQPIEVRYE